MECKLIKGFREGSHLLHVPSEDHLYVLKTNRGGQKIYICYQTLLFGPKKNGQSTHEEDCCTARVRLISDELCEKMSEHSCHKSHKQIISDMKSVNNMKKKCKNLKKNHSHDSHKVSTRNIYQQEIAKYVFSLIDTNSFCMSESYLFGIIQYSSHHPSIRLIFNLYSENVKYSFFLLFVRINIIKIVLNVIRKDSNLQYFSFDCCDII